MPRAKRQPCVSGAAAQGFNLTAMLRNNKQVYNAFKAVCYLNGKSATDVMVELMKKYISENVNSAKDGITVAIESAG